MRPVPQQKVFGLDHINASIVKVIQTRWGQLLFQAVIARLTITGTSILLNVNAILLLAL